MTKRNKLIIENRTNKEMKEILPYVLDVVKMGKISGSGDKKQYCYHTSYSSIEVSAGLNKKSDRIVVYQEGN